MALAGARQGGGPGNGKAAVVRHYPGRSFLAGELAPRAGRGP